MSSLALQLQSYRLTTARIFYHMPDHPTFLQEYIWQELDVAPRYPILRKFLSFWKANLDGKLHSVTVAQSALLKPSEFRAVNGQWHIH